MIWATELDAAGLSQGDLVAEAIFANVYPTVPVQKGSAKGGTAWMQQQAWKEDADGICHVVAKGRKAMGLVLSHSCDIDKKQKKSRIFIAPVRPLSSVAPAEQQRILEQRRVASFPIVGTNHGELYADLRLATSIDPRMLNDVKRLASMTEAGRRMLQARLLVLFARLELDGTPTPAQGDEEDEV